MAKEEGVNIIERHVEKAVLVLCVALLAWVVLHWVVSSPRVVEIVGSSGTAVPVPPGEIDDILKKAADSINQRVRQGGEVRKDERPFAYRKVLQEVAATPFPPLDPLLCMGVPGKALSLMEANVASGSAEDLAAAIPVPGKPVGGALLEFPEPAKDAAPADVAAFHGVSIFPWSDLTKGWFDKLSLKPQPVILRVDVESRQQQPDGNWSAPMAVPAVRVATAATMPAIPDYDKTKPEEVLKAVDDFRAKGMPQAISPPYPKVFDPSVKAFADYKARLPKPALKVVDDIWTKLESNQVGKMALPNLDQQKHAGEVLLWFNDNTLKVGSSYEYRLRVTFVNPLFANEGYAKNPADTLRREMQSPWSEWSDPYVVFNSTEFFLSNLLPSTVPGQSGKLVATVFTRKLGQSVMMNFPLDPGGLIGKPKEIAVFNPLTTSKTASKEIADFSTGAIAVDCLCDRSYVRGRGKPAETTGQLIYLDEKGELCSRMLFEDKVNQRFIDRSNEAGGHR